MTKRLWIAFVLFIVLMISTIIFSGYVAYRNYGLDTNDGTTQLMGLVFDSNSEPITDVNITVSGNSTMTDEDGVFHINDIDVGIITVEFYKPGYVPIELTWLAYPLSEIEDDIEDSPNNITTGRDIILYREIETRYPDDVVKLGDIEMIIDTNSWPSIKNTAITYGNGSGEMNNYNISDGPNTILLSGNGNIVIGKPDGEMISSWKQIPGTSVDITWMVLETLNISNDHRPEMIELTLDPISSDQEEDLNLTVVIIDPIDGKIVLDGTYSQFKNNGTINVHPGRSSISIVGREVRDIEYAYLDVSGEMDANIKIDVIKAEPDKVLEGMSLDWNYVLSVIYLVISILFGFGAYKVVKGTRWTTPFIVALLGFLVRGIYIGPLNLNLIFSTIIVIILFTSRKEFAIREDRNIKEN